jgi:hypothetical protein
MNPNGAWTIFFADLSGGAQSDLVSWGLEVTAVPEPTTWALGIFGALAGAAGLARRWQERRAALDPAALLREGACLVRILF